MCDNIDDALLADEGGIDGDYDIRAEDEEALLEEDNFDDQNLVSSSNRNYYGTREELEEEELDHEPEEPEDILESDENVSDLQEEDANESFNTSANQREKRDTKFVSERNVAIDNSQVVNKYKNPIGRPQQRQFNRNPNTNNRGGRFRGRGRGNMGNRSEAGKKVLINPHFAGNVPFNNRARLHWHGSTNAGNTAGRIQPWNQQIMPPPQNQRQIPQFMQQINTHQKPPVHQRLGTHHLDYSAPIHPPQPIYPPPHIYQSPPLPPPPQIIYHHPVPQYTQPPPLTHPHTYPTISSNAPPQTNYQMSIPPPPMPQYAVQTFNSPPPGYSAPSIGYEQTAAPPQHVTTFEFQPPPQQMPPPYYPPQFDQNTCAHAQDARRVYAPRGIAQKKQMTGRFVVRGGLEVRCDGKRRYQGVDTATAQRRRRTAEIANLHEVPTVDSTTMVRMAPVAAKTVSLEEDEETRIYRQKIENQKKIREKILAQKEERRKQAALRTAAEKGLANLTPPSEILAQLIPEKQSPIPAIISHNPPFKRRIINAHTTVTLNVTKTLKKAVENTATPTTTNKDEISSFLANRRIIAKDQSLANTSVVVVSNLAAGTSEVKLRKLCRGVGDVQVSVCNGARAHLVPNERVKVNNNRANEEKEMDNSIVCIETEIETIVIDDDDKNS